MANKFFNVDIGQIAQNLQKTRDVVEQKVIPAVEKLSISAHAFIINKANNELSGFKREFFLGLGKYGKDTPQQSTPHPEVNSTPRHVRWIKVSNGIWVVEIDPKASWIEDGRPPTSMATEQWLLKPTSKGVKTAKDGSKYRAIPFVHMQNGKLTDQSHELLKPVIKSALKEQKISPRKIEMDELGNPKLGIIHRLHIEPPSREKYPEMAQFFSRPRSEEEAALTGLRPHSGIFYLQNAVVVQRKKTVRGKERISKEVVVFRTVSTKHQLEHRWIYPEVKPFHAIEAAYNYVQQEWQKVLKDIEESLR
jgi:hypothetical protein